VSDELTESIEQHVEEPEPAEAPAPDDPLAALAAERDEYLALAQRVQADFENYRKRALRDQERLVAHAHERLVRELLPVLDDLERAAKPPVRESGPREGVRGNRVEVPPAGADQPDLRAELDAVRAGVKLVEKALRSALAKEGLVEIETDGGFDPHVHEALLTAPSDGAEAGSVVEVVQRGYRLGDKVVRPARVIVAE
jgi:molecular chaperone GrpE